MLLKLKQSKKPGKSKISGKKSIISIDPDDLEIVDIDSVKPWIKNPKKYGKKIDEIIKSLDQYGQQTPICVWREDSQIYKGNTTWYAMKKKGYQKIAVLWKDYKDAREAQGYALIDNTTGSDPEWDQGLLASLLQSEEFSGLDSKEIGILTGFKDNELKGLLLSTSELPELLPDVDLTGTIPDKADFIVIQFQSKEDMQKFKERLGFKTKHPRVVIYEDLLNVMEWKELGSSLNIPQKKILKLKRR